jgi:hypothetical protein
VLEWPLYIPHGATQRAACHRPSGVMFNGTSAIPPRNVSKEFMEPVRSDEVAQMVAPIRFAFGSRSHSHSSMPISRSGTCVLLESGFPPWRGKWPKG